MFDYFYGAQADQFTFYRIPKNLFTDSRFSDLSSDAKVLYGLMLDRMGLSAKNGWQDEQGRIYIVFSIEEVCAAMSVSNKTACKYMAELDTAKGIGLVERVRLGQGRKDRIYVLNFISANDAPMQQSLPVSTASGEDKPTEKKDEHESPDFPAVSHKAKNYTSRSVKSTLQEKAPEIGTFQKCKNYTSENVESTLLEVKKVHAVNETDSSNNKFNNTMLPISRISHSNKADISIPAHDRPTEAMPRSWTYEEVRAGVEEQIEADKLKEEYGEVIAEIVELITDVMITPAPTLRIAGADRPIEVLRAQFAKLKAAHVEDALWNLRQHSSGEITDIKAYLRTLLYNALFTMEARIISDLILGVCQESVSHTK